MGYTQEWPKITGIFLSYNTGSFVVEAIQSVIASGYPNLELICIDDGSTDQESVEILKEFSASSRFGTLILNSSNRGICRSLNLGLSRTSGEMVFALGDDLFTPYKLWNDVKQMQLLDSDYALVHSRALSFHSSSTMNSGEFNPPLDDPPPPDSADFNELLRNHGYVNAVTALFRRSALEKIGGWDESFPYEDKPMWFALAKAGYKFRFRPEITTYYRKHEKQITSTFQHGVFLYQIRLFRKYEYFPAARAAMRMYVRMASMAEAQLKLPGLDACLDEYHESYRYSRLLYLMAKFRMLPYLILGVRGIKQVLMRLAALFRTVVKVRW